LLIYKLFVYDSQAENLRTKAAYHRWTMEQSQFAFSGYRQILSRRSQMSSLRLFIRKNCCLPLPRTASLLCFSKVATPAIALKDVPAIPLRSIATGEIGRLGGETINN